MRLPSGPTGGRAGRKPIGDTCWPTGTTGPRARLAPGQERFLKRQLSLPVSMISVSIARRPARKGRNPGTGEAIRIKASNVLKFRPAMPLKRAAGAA